ncbi:MAG TPA: thiamine phosphate synthase [Solirubrobacteraceae bacterium]|nr:thiamine phosphate synthase [Solirubrobacteraceae bacterium]
MAGEDPIPSRAHPRGRTLKGTPWRAQPEGHTVTGAGKRASGQAGSRRARLAAARLYLVLGAAPAHHELPDLLRAAAAGGVDVVQLREKSLPDDELAAVAHASRILCEQLGLLFIVNDRPPVAAEIGADGVHVGQDDMPVGEVRELLGDDMLVGLSTHTPSQIDASDPSLVDYIGVGPVHATPTKPGRPAVGVELVRYAAAHAPVPFFAIGGLDAANVGEVLDAGAERVCVLRAITDADDPERAARELARALEASGEERSGRSAGLAGNDGTSL